MITNQDGDPVRDEIYNFPEDFKDKWEIAQAVLLLAERLKVNVVNTNATKHGERMIILKEIE